MPFGQFAASTQFYLYGKQQCTRTGWEKACSQYQEPITELNNLDLNDRVFMVTGANSGIGFESASFLAKKNASVYMVCRNPERAEAAKNTIMEASNNENVFVILGDCGLQSGVDKIWHDFVDHRKSLGFDDDSIRLNGLLCNAGGLNNEAKAALTSEGIETTFAAHLLFGTYRLAKLALPTLQNTPDSRVIVVSSGGMYNTKFPSWNRATARRGKFDGQFAYAYAKRGQVLLCEEWTKEFKTVKFASCHPGWVDTPGVEAAYGSSKSYLEPMRNLWEGSEGILWLLVTPADNIEGGGFYLDRTPRVKHIAGPFFSEGSFTKNTPAEVETMMTMLEKWSSLPFQDGPLESLLPEEKVARISYEESLSPLKAMDGPFDIKRYMGKWYVQANIPTFVDKGTINNTEEYRWDEQKQQVKVSFKYSAAVATRREGEEGGEKEGQKEATVSPGPVQEVLQVGTLMNPQGTEWALKVKFLFYIPVPMRYLVIAVNEEVEGGESATCSEGGENGTTAEYTSCMIGVPDRSAVWIMNRSKEPMSEEVLAAYTLKAKLLGYDVSPIVRVPTVEAV